MWQAIFKYIFPPQCGGCGETGSGLCEGCAPRGNPLRRRLSTLTVTTFGAYEGNLRRAVLSLKSGRRDVAAAAALRLAEIAPRAAVLIPVPTTAVRRRERGFDGCVLMARVAAASINGTTLPHLKQARGDRQRGRSRGERLAAHGRFRWDGEPLHGMKVTLLDDVVTTGATLEDCARSLRAAGATVEDAVAIALTP